MELGTFIEQICRYDRQEYFECYGQIEERLHNLEKILGTLEEAQRSMILEQMEHRAGEAPVWVRIHLLSFCMKVSKTPAYTQELLQTVLDADWNEVGEYEKLSDYWQIGTAVFADARLKGERTQEQLAALYRMLFDAFCGALGIKGQNYVPVEERDGNLVFVMTSQVLGQNHAPTKTLLDRCLVLKKYLRKKVVIINTAMQISGKGVGPFYDLCEAGYLPELCSLDHIEFQGEVFEFHQCANDMPNLDTMVQLVEMIRERKPCYLLDIGESDICADICGMFVPEITVGTVFSAVAMSCGEYQLLDGKPGTGDLPVLECLGVDVEKIAAARFTFVFKPQEHHYTRQELGIWEHGFVLMIVGWRLDSEIADDFLAMLDRIAAQRENVQVVFMGRYESWQSIQTGYERLWKHTRYLGKQEDALAVFACGDLYVNPRRAGGGSSVAEALYQGLPAVTLPEGDVPAAAGEAFRVRDYEQMEREILRYMDDAGYYGRQSARARERAKELLDSRKSFGEAIGKLEEKIKDGVSC